MYLEDIVEIGFARKIMISKPSWRSWLARQSHNLKVVSSSLTEGILLCHKSYVTYCDLRAKKFQVSGLERTLFHDPFKAKIEKF